MSDVTVLPGCLTQSERNDMNALVASLGDLDFNTREAAQAELVQLLDDAVEARYCQDRRPQCAINAIKQLIATWMTNADPEIAQRASRLRDQVKFR